MLLVSNENLIRELIKRDYEFSLDRIRQVSDIIRIANIKTIEDWDKVVEYLEEFTEKCKEEGFRWCMDFSIDTYARYLKKFNYLGNKPILFPEQDIFYIVSGLEARQEELIKETAKNITKNMKYYPEE